MANPSKSSSDQELVAAFLERIGESKGRQAGRSYEGVTPDDISRWRRGAWKRLSGDKRDALLRILSHPAREHAWEDSTDVAEGVPGGALDSFWKRVDEIHALPISDGMKILRVDALAAAIRAEYARQAESAAEARARAVERAESGAEARAKAIERAEESARDRARALGERGTGGANQQQLVDEVLRALTERDEAAAKERDRNLQ